jgi:dTDP-glucose 4,6-dehydratase
MILNAMDGDPLPVYGKGTNVRDWLHVTDHCRAIREIMLHGRHGRTYNVGGNCEKTNMEVITRICETVDHLMPPLNQSKQRTSLITYVADRPGHDLRYAMDFSRLRKELGWEPVETFETGLEKTIGWYMDNRIWADRVRSGQYRQWIETHYGSLTGRA